MQIREASQVSYLTTDHLGSPRVITDQDGDVTTRKDYTAFGEENISAERVSGLGYTGGNETRKGYTGYEKDDESGLDFAQARYYNSTHGRYTSIDPLTASASIKNPQTFNRYTYVLNSPYKFTDPLGLIPATTGADGGKSESPIRCNLFCKVKYGGELTKHEIQLLQFHVANGTALGYMFQSALSRKQNSSSSYPSRTASQNTFVKVKVAVEANWSVENNGQSQPVASTVKKILDSTASDIASNVASAIIAIDALQKHPRSSVTMSFSTSVGVSKSGPSFEASSGESTTFDSPDTIRRSLTQANNMLIFEAVGVLEELNVLLPSGRTFEVSLMKNAPSTCGGVDCNLAAAFGELALRTGRAKGREEVERRLPKLNVPWDFYW